MKDEKCGNNNIGDRINNLSQRAKRWGGLLMTYGPYGIMPLEAIHIGIDRLVDRNIPDGREALLLVFDSLADLADKKDTYSKNRLSDIMKGTITVSRYEGINILHEAKEKSPYPLVTRLAEKLVKGHKHYLGLRSYAVDGEDYEASTEVKRILSGFTD
ncbi:hypothetical protein HYT56_01660 [Candidatus Woesearchaeota archaeon]|nr:hypothetical protein [Candidatus Woesearchaeota archaeon]